MNSRAQTKRLRWAPHGNSVEGPSRRNAARLEGRTRCNKIVVFEGGERFVGQVMDVEIESASPATLYGNPAILNLN